MAKELNFNFETGNTATSGRNQIAYTAQLNAVSNQRALEALRAATTNPELFAQAKAALDSGEAVQLFSFLEATVGQHLVSDAEFMQSATESELDSMLESRRSDRSKTKAKGLNTHQTASKYLATGYAEMIVRSVWNKPYDSAQSTSELDASDIDAVNRKIKSLQSKKSRLIKLVELGDAAAQQTYDEVVAEIDRLAQFRPDNKVVGKAVIKDADTELLRAALQQVDKSALDADQLAKLEILMSRLG